MAGCDGAETRRPLNFQEAGGSLTAAPEGLTEVPLSLAADDTAFYGPPSAGEKVNALEVSLRSADNRAWLSLHILDVRGARGYVLDSKTEGRLTLPLVETCNGAMGDLLGPGCRWYSSDFFSAGCTANLEVLHDDDISGSVTCRALGANCPTGTGLRDAAGACTDGERYTPVGLTASFRMRQPQ